MNVPRQAQAFQPAQGWVGGRHHWEVHPGADEPRHCFGDRPQVNAVPAPRDPAPVLQHLHAHRRCGDRGSGQARLPPLGHSADGCGNRTGSRRDEAKKDCCLRKVNIGIRSSVNLSPFKLTYSSFKQSSTVIDEEAIKIFSGTGFFLVCSFWWYVFLSEQLCLLYVVYFILQNQQFWKVSNFEKSALNFWLKMAWLSILQFAWIATFWSLRIITPLKFGHQLSP